MGDPPRIFFRDAGYDGQLTRSLAASYAHAADLGEVLATAREIGRPNPSRWYASWSARGDTARASAESARGAGERINARNAYLRASEYYRQAFYYLRRDLDDERLHSGHAAHVDSFARAIELMDCRVERVHIGYDTTTLKGYFFAPDGSGAVRPTVVFPCGYDSTAEAGWVEVPSAVERDYNALVFEGPGQGEALYVQRLLFRPDFEHVLTQIVNWLVDRPEVDADKLVLIGRSFAGYLAPRAASTEHRIAALVCDPAQPTMTHRLPTGLLRRIAAPVVRLQMRLDSNRAEFFGARMAAHGLRDIADYFEELGQFTMLDRAHQITCPTLIVESEDDFAGGSGQTLYDALQCPAQLVHLSTAQGAGGHCAGLGQQVWEEVVYGWIRKALAGFLTPRRRGANRC